jgi:hypothetical protein
MRNMTKSQATTPIPVQLSRPEFISFIFPHLSMPMRGPKCKLGYHCVFNLIPVKVYREGREDRAYLLERHGAGAREMSEGRSVEARQHDSEAPLQSHLTEHLRRRDAGGENGADHARLVRDGPLRNAGLPQLQDLAWRPGVDVGEFAFTDLFA